ncbi:MAG TPA: pyridoxal-phosphate dependent enzyme, partial [Anaerolineales bacterium]|nr:pyridoxal-phosphate dependent enzyme [Anaerolineales bacterium]
AMESVSDREAFDAMHKLAKTEGMAVEPAAAVAFAGLEKLVAQSVIGKDQLVAVNCTGHTFPVEKHVLGDQWRVDLHLSDDQRPVQREGLVAALDQLDEKTTTVLLIDDNPDDALLIRRLLEAKKSYRVFHAADGEAGLAEARQRLPDLIICDLTMPKTDGFTVIEELRRDRRTSEIPVIVVSAKDISAEDRKRLSEGNIEALYQKGSLSPRAFVDQVVQVLGDKTSREGE